jgi:hypothetical protein
MTETTHQPIDRTGWGPGPWDNEPDRAEWKTSAGLPALIVRSRLGNLCGYVAVPPGHVAHGVHYNRVDVSVHGELTYSNECQGQICHVPEPGEPDAGWWLGFDCAHHRDARPGDAAMWRRLGRPELIDPAGWTTYRDMAYVRVECEQLAEQLAAMKGG